MITNDGCYAPGQSAAKRFLLSRDRGRYVRTEREYLELAARYFGKVKPNIREDVLRIPYTHLILECIRGTAEPAQGRI